MCRKGSVHEFVSSYGVLSIDDDPYAEDHFAWIISHFGPLAVSVDSSSDAFQNYAGGIFPADLCERNIDHAMVIVGYAPDYWIIKNSWSSEWGEDGYMRLERGSNACGIASYATYVRTVHMNVFKYDIIITYVLGTIFTIMYISTRQMYLSTTTATRPIRPCEWSSRRPR